MYSKINNDKEQHRNQLKNQMDNFTKFTWGTHDMYDEFGMFIINEKEGGLKMYNGPSFSNQYTKGQFSSEGNYLAGINFNVQTIEFTVGMYYFTIAEYRQMLKILSPYEINNLSFSFNPEWHYQVKLKNISDSPKYIIGSQVIKGRKDFTEYYYYTELKLTFEIQGSPCLYTNEEYKWVDKDQSTTKATMYLTEDNVNYHEGDNIIRSDLDFPFDIKIPFKPWVNSIRDNFSKVPFINREIKIKNDKGYALIESIGGNTIAFNQVLDSERLTTTSFNFIQETSKTVNNGVVNFTYEPSNYATASVKEISYGYNLSGQEKPYIYEGHKYALLGNIAFDKISNNTRVQLYNISKEGTVGKIYNDLLKNFKEKIFTFDNGFGLSNYFRLYLDNIEPSLFDTTLKLDVGLRIVDLTQCYGAGNEPTSIDDPRITWLKSYFALHPDYNEGTLINAKPSELTSYGANLWDEETKLFTPTRLSNKNPIKAMPNQSYYLGGFTNDVYADVRLRDNIGNLISQIPVKNTTFVTTNDTETIEIIFSANYGIVYNNDIILAFGNKPVSYIPYVKPDKLKVPYIDYFPEGMNGVGNVRDTIEKDKATKRYGEVDLGTLSWKKVGEHNDRFSAYLSNFHSYHVYSIKDNLVCDKYVNYSRSELFGNVTTGITSQNDILFIQDSAFNGLTNEQVNTALSGVILRYELADPVVTPIEPTLNLFYPVQKGGIESWDSEVPIATSGHYISFTSSPYVDINISVIREQNNTEQLLETLLKCRLANLTQLKAQPELNEEILANTFYIHYFSETGVVLYSIGDATDSLLTLMSSGSNGRRLVEQLETQRFMFARDEDLSPIKIKIELTNGEFDMSQVESDMYTPNIQIHSNARTNIA